MDQVRRNYAVQLDEFLADQTCDLKVLFESPGSVPFHELSQLCVFDSSFNPPSTAHSYLANLGVDILIKENSKASTDVGLIFLLSVNNADKDSNRPAPLPDRLMMIHMMSLYHQQHLSTRSVYIGLIKHAKFIDKRIAFHRNFPHIQNVIFPLGFDTLERLLMPKYYLPNSIAHTLDPFFETTRVVCLIRHTDNEIHDTISSQSGYLEDIRNGSVAGLSPWWASKIHLVEPSVSTIGISSTVVRELLKQDHPADRKTLEKYVLPDILDYILERALY